MSHTYFIKQLVYVTKNPAQKYDRELKNSVYDRTTHDTKTELNLRWLALHIQTPGQIEITATT
jgi:hypothetical protein